MGERARRWKHLLSRVLLLPASFLGVGLYRAWLSIFFRYGAYPGMDVSDYALFEVSIGLACLAAAYWWRKIVPLWSNDRILILAGIGMVAGSIACAIWAFILGLRGCVCACVQERPLELRGGLPDNRLRPS